MTIIFSKRSFVSHWNLIICVLNTYIYTYICTLFFFFLSVKIGASHKFQPLVTLPCPDSENLQFTCLENMEMT